MLISVGRGCYLFIYCTLIWRIWEERHKYSKINGGFSCLFVAAQGLRSHQQLSDRLYGMSLTSHHIQSGRVSFVSYQPAGGLWVAVSMSRLFEADNNSSNSTHKIAHHPNSLLMNVREFIAHNHRSSHNRMPFQWHSRLNTSRSSLTFILP